MIHSSGIDIMSSEFQFPLTVASRISHPHSIEDQAPRLIVKQFSIARKSQRDSQSYEEQRKGRWEIEVPWTRKGRVKTGETNDSAIKRILEKIF